MTLNALLPSVAAVKACNVPPLKFNAPVPNALVALFASNVPAVNVVAPVYVLLPLMANYTSGLSNATCTT